MVFWNHFFFRNYFIPGAAGKGIRSQQDASTHPTHTVRITRELQNATVGSSMWQSQVLTPSASVCATAICAKNSLGMFSLCKHASRKSKWKLKEHPRSGNSRRMKRTSLSIAIAWALEVAVLFIFAHDVVPPFGTWLMQIPPGLVSRLVASLTQHSRRRNCPVLRIIATRGPWRQLLWQFNIWNDATPLRHTLALEGFVSERLESVEKIAKVRLAPMLCRFVGDHIFVFRICFKKVAGDILVNGRALQELSCEFLRGCSRPNISVGRWSIGPGSEVADRCW